MTPWFALAALVGWPLVGFFVLFGDTDGGGDGLDAGGGDGAGHALAALVGSFLSLTGLAFFSAFFGLTGLVLTWLGAATGIAVVWAVVIGAFAAWSHGALVRWLVRTSSDSSVADRDLEGRTAEVTLPVGDGRKGRIAVEVNGQRVTYMALPYRPDADTYPVGGQVVIVEVDDSVALVVPMDDLG